MIRRDGPCLPFPADMPPSATVAIADSADLPKITGCLPTALFGNFRQCWGEPEAFPVCLRDSSRSVTGRNCSKRVDMVFETCAQQSPPPLGVG